MITEFYLNTVPFDKVMQALNDTHDDITDYETLKEYAEYNTGNDNFNVAIHILQVLSMNSAEWYQYDYSMGTCSTPRPIRNKQDIYDCGYVIEED